MAAGNPKFVVEDERTVFVPFFPFHICLQLLPVFAILRIPGVSPIAAWVVGPPAEDPEVLPIDGCRKPEPGRPRGGIGFLLPVDSVFRRPDIVLRVVLRHIIAAAEDIHFVSQHCGLMIGSRRPAGVIGCQSPCAAVRGIPHVVLEALVVAKVVVFRPAENSHLLLKDNDSSGNPGRPLCGCCRPFPFRAVDRGPNFVTG